MRLRAAPPERPPFRRRLACRPAMPTTRRTRTSEAAARQLDHGERNLKREVRLSSSEVLSDFVALRERRGCAMLFRGHADVAMTTPCASPCSGPATCGRSPTSSLEPNAEQATRQIERALEKLGQQRYRVPGFPVAAARGHRKARARARSDDRRLRPLVLWPPHDRGRRRQGQSAAAREQLFRASGRASSVCSTRARASKCSAGRFRASGRPPTTGPADEVFMAQLEEWCTHGRHRVSPIETSSSTRP